MTILKDLKLEVIIYQNELLIIITSLSMEKSFMKKLYIKRYEEIRKLTTGQGEDYTTGCLLDFDYIKNHYRLIAFHLIRQKELKGDPKAIPQIEFIGQLKNPDHAIVVNESMFALTNLEKNKEKRLKFSQGSVTVL